MLQTITRPIPNAEPQNRAAVSSEKDDEFLCLPNLMRQAYLFSQAGLGLPSEFYVRVTLALRELARDWPVVSLRCVCVCVCVCVWKAAVTEDQEEGMCRRSVTQTDEVEWCSTVQYADAV